MLTEGASACVPIEVDGRFIALAGYVLEPLGFGHRVARCNGEMVRSAAAREFAGQTGWVKGKVARPGDH